MKNENNDRGDNGRTESFGRGGSGRHMARLAALLALAVGVICVCVNFYGLFTVGYICVFRRVTGYPCPGCGMSRALLALLELRFSEAFGYHPLVFLLPVMLFIGVMSVFDKNTKRRKAYFIAFLIFIVAMAVCWAVRLCLGWRG